MNGFANSLLSILLSWIRALVSNIWTIINSEDGGTVYRFLAGNWMMLLLILLAGGFVIDRIVYLLRWRPHYVWLSRLDHLRRGKRRKNEPETVFPTDPVPEIAAQTAVYQPVPSPTIAYAPARQANAAPAEAYTQIYAPPSEELLFDEPVMQWQEEAWQTPEAPSADPNAYYRDVQSGFAPAISPEQLYAPRTRSSAADYQQPVHPGLDDEAFRQSFGLQEEEPQPVPVMRAPAFRPFTVKTEDTAPVRPQSTLSRLARGARSLVGVDDEDQPLTIRDLHSTVDVSQAFHEPVYPQNMKMDN